MKTIYCAASLLLLLGVVAGGCIPGKSDAEAKDGQKLTRKPRRPPDYPPAKVEPRDMALRARAVQELLAGVKSESPLLRAHAIEGIKDAGLREGYPAIVSAMDDSHAMVCFAACMAAGELRLPDARAGALQLLRDSNENLQVAGVFVLHRLGDTRYSHTFEKAAVSPDFRLRSNTALLLGLLGEPSAKKILDVMLRDSSPAVRLQAAEALWRLGDEQALEYLVTATISRYPDDRMIAAWALAGPRKPQVIEHLRGMLVTDYVEVNLLAARAMGRLGSDEGYGIATRAAAGQDSRHRQLAALVLGDIGRIDAQGVLRKLMEDADPDVRLAAAQAILELRG